MHVNFSLVTFCLLALVSCIYCKVPSSPFIKNEKSYVSSYGDSPQSPSTGYHEILKELTSQYKASKISYTELNKFGPALDELFLIKYLQKLYEEQLANRKTDSSSIPDVLFVPEYIDSGTGLQFKELKVYGFPANKKGAKPEYVFEAGSSALEFLTKNKYNSDNVILAGSVYIDGQDYFFVHRLFQPTLEEQFHYKRESADPVHVKRSLSYQNEDLIGTYDSSYPNASEINAILQKSVTEYVLPHLFFNLSSSTDQYLEYQTAKSGLEFTQSYHQTLKNDIVNAAAEYVKDLVKANNGNDIFKSSDIVYKIDSKSAPLPFQRDTLNIQLKGISNYDKIDFVYENVSISGGDRFYNMSQGIILSYPQEGDKKAFVNFDFKNGHHVYAREFTVKNITIISEYLADLTSKQPSVYRNKEVFFNKAGFLVRIETTNTDEIYDYVVRHIGNDIARAIQLVVEGANPFSSGTENANQASAGTEESIVSSSASPSEAA